MELWQCSIVIIVVLMAINPSLVDSTDPDGETKDNTKVDSGKEDSTKVDSGKEDKSKGDAGAEDNKPKAPPLTRDTLNSWINDYFKCFERLKGTMTEEDQKAMNIMEKLTLQSWISTLEPDVLLVKEFVSGDESATAAAIKENLIKTLKGLGKPEVEKTLLYYANGVHNKLRDKLIEEGNAKMEAKEPVDTETHNYAVHTMFCPRMYMQSFIFDFVPEPRGDTYVFKFEGGNVKIEIGNYITTDWKEFY